MYLHLNGLGDTYTIQPCYWYLMDINGEVHQYDAGSHQEAGATLIGPNGQPMTTNRTVCNTGPLPARQGFNIIQRLNGQYEYLMVGLPHPDRAGANTTPSQAYVPPSQTVTMPVPAAPSNTQQPLVIQDTSLPLAPGGPIQTMAPVASPEKSSAGLLLALAVLGAGLLAGN